MLATTYLNYTLGKAQLKGYWNHIRLDQNEIQIRFYDNYSILKNNNSFVYEVFFPELFLMKHVFMKEYIIINNIILIYDVSI